MVESILFGAEEKKWSEIPFWRKNFVFMPHTKKNESEINKIKKYLFHIHWFVNPHSVSA